MIATKLGVDMCAMMNKKARRFRFTWNNYTEDNVKLLQEITSDKCDYVCWGFEKGLECGTPHLQGYIEFKNPISGTAAKGRLDPVMKTKSKVNLMLCDAKRSDNISYCKKEESGDVDAIAKYGGKFIEVIHREKAQGVKDNVFNDIVDRIVDGADFHDIMVNFPCQAIKHHAGIKHAIDAQKEFIMKEELDEEFKDSKLRGWQQNLLKICSYDKADDRAIYWVYDTVGNMGKTWFSKYMLAKHNATRFENCGSAHVAHAYNGEKIIMFDYSRSVEGHLNYGAIESVKNGMMFASKYDSKHKCFRTPHVICFANWLPNIDTMSRDRWHIICLNDERNNVVGEAVILRVNVKTGVIYESVHSLCCDHESAVVIDDNAVDSNTPMIYVDNILSPSDDGFALDI